MPRRGDCPSQRVGKKCRDKHHPDRDYRFGWELCSHSTIGWNLPV
jgi:hypothetical protein